MLLFLSSMLLGYAASRWYFTHKSDYTHKSEWTEASISPFDGVRKLLRRKGGQ